LLRESIQALLGDQFSLGRDVLLVPYEAYAYHLCAIDEDKLFFAV